MLLEEKAQRLVDLAKKAFPEPPLARAEREMLRAAARGRMADRRAGNAAEDNPAGAEKWGADRAVRAKLLRWLCTEHEASGLVDHRGVQVRGVRIDGRPDLSCADVPFPLGFWGCAFPAGLDLMHARLPGLFLNGSHTRSITADRVTVTGGVFLRDKFHATGEVRLLGASVGGNLVCSDGTFENPDGAALNADGIQVTGGVFLHKGFHASGEVRLLNASVGGNLECSRGQFENPDAYALSADRIQVTGTVFLDEKFHATGVVRLLGASVGGNLDCSGGTFENPDADALCADRIQVTGNVFLGEKFQATGVVRLPGVSVGQNLDCSGGRFENPEGAALNADGIQVKGAVFLRQDFHATGVVRLLGASVGVDLDCSGGTFENPGGRALDAEGARIHHGLLVRGGRFGCDSGVNLAYARVRVLADAPVSWPARGRLVLDGFTYEGIKGETGAKGRLEWLERQYPEDRNQWRGTFRPQPYDHLARVLKQTGHEAEAVKVLIGKHRHLRRYGTLSLRARAWDRFLGFTVGHGHRVWYLSFPALFFFLLGTFIFQQAKSADLIVPACANADAAAQRVGRFCPWMYSLDVLLPVVNLHQEEVWRPDPTNRLLRWYFWAQILAGWFLATLLVAGLTGIVRRE